MCPVFILSYACILTGNGKIVPLAAALCVKEDAQSIKWMLNSLLENPFWERILRPTSDDDDDESPLEKRGPLVIVIDRGPALFKAFSELLPNAILMSCAVHLWRNIEKKSKNSKWSSEKLEKVKQFFWMAQVFFLIAHTLKLFDMIAHTLKLFDCAHTKII